MKKRDVFWKREPDPKRTRHCGRCKQNGLGSVAYLTRAGECWFMKCATCGYEGGPAYCSPHQAWYGYRNNWLLWFRKDRKKKARESECQA